MKRILISISMIGATIVHAQNPTPPLSTRAVNPSSIVAPADSNLQSALQIMASMIDNGAPGMTAKQVQDALGKDKVARIRAAAKAYNGK